MITTLILDWSDWNGPASGWVTLTRRTWRRDPDTYRVPWQVSLRVEGRAVVDVQAVAGEVVSATASDGNLVIVVSGANPRVEVRRLDDGTLVQTFPLADAASVVP